MKVIVIIIIKAITKTDKIMILYRQKVFTSFKRKFAAHLERNKRNARVIGGAVKGGVIRLGQQTADLARHRGTVKDVVTGVVDENKKGLSGFFKNSGAIVKTGSIPLSKKVEFVGKQTLRMTNPLAVGGINATQKFVQRAGYKGEDITRKLGELRYDPIRKLGEEADNLRKAKVLGMGSSIAGNLGAENIASGLGTAQKSISGIWYSRPGETGAEAVVLGGNIGITPKMITDKLSNSWRKNSGVDVSKEIQDFQRQKDVRGLSWYYDKHIARRLNPIKAKSDQVVAAVDNFGNKATSTVQAAGQRVAGGVRSIFGRIRTQPSYGGESTRSWRIGRVYQPQLQPIPVM